ncbi:MAG TPA: MarC family protein [Acidimicrobiales bacterium]|nr:MarC family protein [Acidimicrobiales bacterium]
MGSDRPRPARATWRWSLWRPRCSPGRGRSPRPWSWCAGIRAAAGRAAVVGGILVALLVVGAALLLAERLSRAVGPTIVQFLTRVLGLLLSAIAVQLIVDGVRALVRAGA